VTSRHERVDEVFLHAETLDEAARESYLAEVAMAEPTIAERVREMIATSARMPKSFLGGTDGARRSMPDWVGPYRVVREIGRGGMGVVYEAEQQSPRRRVAVKLVPPALASDELLRRFELEAELLGRLQDPGIARIYDAGSAEVGGLSTPYIAMEYIEGLPLDTYTERAGISARAVVELVARVCDAVQHAHQRGVSHRDPKPRNIPVEASETAAAQRGDTNGTSPTHLCRWRR